MWTEKASQYNYKPVWLLNCVCLHVCVHLNHQDKTNLPNKSTQTEFEQQQ